MVDTNYEFYRWARFKFKIIYKYPKLLFWKIIFSYNCLLIEWGSLYAINAELL